MRTLSATSRALCVAAAVVAAALILGGAYFVGYVGEVQRDLNDPASLRRLAAGEIATIEKSLGYDGFLKAYRNYRLTGDPIARPEMNDAVAKASRAIAALQTLYAGDEAASDALREAASVTGAFAHIAKIAPELGDAALRGSAGMETLNTLPQSPQLEATYVSLRSALDRVRQADIEHQLGGAASALNWTQMLVIGAIALVVLGLLIVAGLLQLGIIQPLKALEHSLTSVGDGAVGQKIWGVDRKDEFGALARAGEKVRRSLTETTALKTLADKGQLHLTLEGNASVIFEKLAADVSTATDALKNASADIVKLQDDNRRQFEAALKDLKQSGAGFEDAAKTAHKSAAAAIDDMRASTAKLTKAADDRAAELGEIAKRFDQSGKSLEQTFAAAKEKANAAAADLTGASVPLKRIAADAQMIQSAFFAACDKISSDAANTSEKVHTLAARLSEAVGSADERLAQKLTALDHLERHLTEMLARMHERSGEAVTALSNAAGTADQRNTAAEARMSKTAAEFEEVLRIFRDGETARSQSSSEVLGQLRAAQQNATETTAAEFNAAIEKLARIARALQAVPPRAAAPAHTVDLEAVTKALRAESETIRNEIRDLAIRLTEDRLLASADMPLLGAKADTDAAPRRTLADVPDAEIMARLQNLAAEMNAAQQKLDQAASLREALTRFANEVRQLATNADRSARLKNMGKVLDRHADEIEAHAGAIDPAAEGVRNEVHAITSELRTIAARAQATGVKEGTALREAAIHLGERAQSLFGRLDDLPAATDDDAPASSEPADVSTADLVALAQLIGRLEARAENLSRSALASRFNKVDEAASAEGPGNELNTDGAIHTVFESIERLNNIAAALARAGDADRQRRAAH